MAAIQSVSKYTDLELALMSMLGFTGNGADRQKLLGSRYDKVQGLINQILNTNTVPAGGGYDPDQIRKAMHAAFDSIINEVTQEVINAIK